jgi:hypothetical protein
MTGCSRSRENVGPPSCVIAALAAAVVILLFAASSARFHHWFVVPVFVCGVLAGTDAVDWLRSKVDLFDPVGIMGLFTTFTLFVSPLLHVEWDVWMWEVTPPSDWREWVGRMAVINVVAMIAYAAFASFLSSPWLPDPLGMRMAARSKDLLERRAAAPLPDWEPADVGVCASRRHSGIHRRFSERGQPAHV